MTVRGLSALFATTTLAACLVGCSGVDQPDPDPTSSPPSSSSPPSPSPSPAESDQTTPPDEWTDAADWAREMFGGFEPLSESGEGDAVIDLPQDIASSSGGIIRVSYSGTEPLSLESLDADGELTMYLLDTSTEYNTADPSTFDGETNWWGANDPPQQLGVVADGSWDIDVIPVHHLPELPDEGEGVRSYLYNGPGGTVEGTKSDADVGLGLTEITPCLVACDWGGSLENIVEGRLDSDFSGELSPGPSWVIVTHRGEWTMTLPE
ncbi:MAG TPA: hypothetical protein H9871_12075 [Candidatus Nesterenkonia stercoripullorum]|uniref:Lipoprotein n=1 Tax=Candidatus Nesterenkonia stercoripullorum TaxID=2838701 RepID=A0A9D2A9F3_9MICC|nr:hypothetical protein [Candidatus Nesterenkonia stercoripullorum]